MLISQLSQSVRLNVKVLGDTMANRFAAPPFFLINIVFQQQPFPYSLQIVHYVSILYISPFGYFNINYEEFERGNIANIFFFLNMTCGVQKSIGRVIIRT